LDLLLDTRVFLWWLAAPHRLGEAARGEIANPANRVFVSAATAWEMAIKRRVGKLDYQGSVSQAVARNGFLELPVLMRDAEGAGELDWDHNDPFDRLLVAQARHSALTLVTADAAVRALGGVAQFGA
jgi:PIN domain nuclease of toxin-antitoxin system